MNNKQCTVCGKGLEPKNKSLLCYVHLRKEYAKKYYKERYKSTKQSKYNIALELLKEYELTNKTNWFEERLINLNKIK